MAYLPNVDDISKGLIFLDVAHNKIHDGNAYCINDTVACNTTTYKWQIVTPNSTTYMHLVFVLTCTGEATFLVTEGSDRGNGVAITVVNRRRIGTPKVAGGTIFIPTTSGSTDGAVTLFSMRNGITGAGGKSVETSSARAENEWILKPNTKYIVSITTYASVYVSCQLGWYELKEG